MQNKGFEFGIDANPINGDFKWNINFNISFNKNTIKKLYNNQDILGGRERFFDILEKNVANSAKEIGKEIYYDLKTFTENAKQNDDITILIVKGV